MDFFHPNFLGWGLFMGLPELLLMRYEASPMTEPSLKRIDWVDTPLGKMAYAWSEKGLHRLAFVGESNPPKLQEHLNLPPQPLSLQGEPTVRDAICAYFERKEKAFQSIPLDLSGSEFQLQVWKMTRSIGFGETRSYGDLSAALNRFNGARAVGFALSKNPIPLFVPCHRVISKSGKLTGYVGGLERKRALLSHESKLDNASQTGLPWG